MKMHMGGAIDGRCEQAERLRGYFDVQLQFAETIADRTSRTLSDTCLKFTNLHRRFGLGRADGGALSGEWTRYAAGLERCASRQKRLEWTVAFFADALPKESATHSFRLLQLRATGPGPCCAYPL